MVSRQLGGKYQALRASDDRNPKHLDDQRGSQASGCLALITPILLQVTSYRFAFSQASPADCNATETRAIFAVFPWEVLFRRSLKNP